MSTSHPHEGEGGSHCEASPGSAQRELGEQKWGTSQEERELLKSLDPAPLPYPVPCGPLGVVHTRSSSELGHPSHCLRPGPCVGPKALNGQQRGLASRASGGNWSWTLGGPSRRAENNSQREARPLILGTSFSASM